VKRLSSENLEWGRAGGGRLKILIPLTLWAGISPQIVKSELLKNRDDFSYLGEGLRCCFTAEDIP